MKRVSRWALITSIIFLIMDYTYIREYLDTIDIFRFLLLVILIPCILISIMIAGIITETHIREIKHQMTMIGVLGMMITVVAYVLATQNQKYIEIIAENSKNTMKYSKLTISNISINNGFSSYIFIFILIFVLSMSVTIIFNILRNRRCKDVYQ